MSIHFAEPVLKIKSPLKKSLKKNTIFVFATYPANIMKYLIPLGLLLVFCSCETSDDKKTTNQILVSVEEVFADGATISWTAPTNTNSQDIVYKILLENEVVEEMYQERTYTFMDLADDQAYVGSIFSLDSDGNETFANFDFETEFDSLGYYTAYNVDLNSQEDVDSFHYTKIELHLTIAGEDIVDLSGLSELEYVGNSIEITNTSLQNLNGLQNLSEAYAVNGQGPEILIKTNHELTDVGALGNYSIIAEDINIINNANLMDMSGFAIKDDISWLHIERMPWADFSPLSNVPAHPGFLSFVEMPNLTDLTGLSNVQSVVHWNLHDNPVLQSLDGIPNLSNSLSQGEDTCAIISIISNPNLTDFCALKTYMNNVSVCEYYDEDENALVKKYFVIGNAYDPTLGEIRTITGCSQ